jgi:hypothetical protein
LSKFLDEWYIVTTYDFNKEEGDIMKIYKCDGFDGLVKCLENVVKFL